MVLASGVAALHAVFFSLLRTGEHAVVSDVTYEAVWRLFADILPAPVGGDIPTEHVQGVIKEASAHGTITLLDLPRVLLTSRQRAVTR